jgi:hypothetical protein
MGFFKNIGKALGGAFKTVAKAVTSTVGKIAIGVGAVIAAPFTGGLSLLTLPTLFAKSTIGKPPSEIIKEIDDPNNLNQNDPNVKTFPKKEPPTSKPSIAALEQVEPFIGLGATTGKKETVTLTGFYYEVNRITIPIDTDLDNVVVVPDTFFPYIAVIDNHSPSNGIRYISEFTSNTLSIAYRTNLDKVIHDLDRDNGNFVYVNFDWQEFVNKYLSHGMGLSKDGGILYWTLTPVFMLQWLDGGITPTYPLEYSYNIPAGVKTVFDLEGDSQSPTTAPRTEATIPTDPKRRDRIANILSGIGAGVAYANLAIAAVGAVKSRLDNAAGAVKNLSKTASDLNAKFEKFKALELSKDIINGKIADLKNLVNTKLPKFATIKTFFQRQKAVLDVEVKPNKKELRRKAKDTKVRGKFGLKSVTGALDKVTGTLDKVTSRVDKVINKIPKIPPAALNLAQKLASSGGKLNIGSLVSVGLPNINLASLIPNFSNINWADPLSAIDGITAGVNGFSSLGERVLDLDLRTNSQKQAEQSQINKAKYDTILSDFQTTAKADLQNYLKTIPLSAPLPRNPIVIPPISGPSVRNSTLSSNSTGGPFKVLTDRSYFHSNSNTSTRRNAYITKGEGGTFTKVENNFGYLRFTNARGVVTEGWLPLSEVQFS